jgi:dTDP-4-amino-4,6-dideoxygalactose transaminase
MAESNRFLPIIKPSLGEPEAAAAGRVILSGWVTQGPEVEAFEREFAGYLGAPHACAVSNCTTALHIALMAVGVGPGDEVVTASHSFIATANAIRYCGATPVFVDIDAATYNMSPEAIERAITSRTKAVLVVHQMGMPANLARTLEIAAARGVPVVEDAACAIGSEIRVGDAWERIGKPHGAVACFSMHPRKLISTGDGGVLTTSDPEIDKLARLLRHHGMNIPDRVRHEAKQVVFEEYPVLGYNYRLTDIQAAVAREQLKRLPGIIERRRALAARYTELLRDVPRVSAPEEPAWARSNWQSYCVRLDDACDQRQVMQALLEQGIATRRGIMNSHREASYPEGTWKCGVPGCDARTCGHLRESEAAQDHAIILPLFHDLTDDEQVRVITALRRATNG